MPGETGIAGVGVVGSASEAFAVADVAPVEGIDGGGSVLFEDGDASIGGGQLVADGQIRIGADHLVRLCQCEAFLAQFLRHSERTDSCVDET